MNCHELKKKKLKSEEKKILKMSETTTIQHKTAEHTILYTSWLLLSLAGVARLLFSFTNKTYFLPELQL